MQPVVTAFIWDGRRVLLALRSAAVSTYPNHWAGISGYLEGDDPLSWALVEIEQECGIARQRLTARAAGEPLEVSDAAHDRQFLVHPFLFSIDSPEGIRHDWEAQRFEWVDLDELLARRRRPTVPMLHEAFERVWPPWPAERALELNLAAAVAWLRNDRTMGAGRLARAAAGELLKLIGLATGDLLPALRPRFKAALDRLAAVRPTMATLANLLGPLVEAIDTATDPQRLAAEVQRRIDRSLRAEADAASRAAQQIAPGERVMTLGDSGTVAAVLAAAAARLGRVLICEGRPLCEGRHLATKLQRSGVPVTLLTEAQAFALMPQVDRVLLGADAVLPEGDVVNKVGSALLALAARHWRKPVTVVADQFKFVAPGAAVEANESNPPSEVWDPAPPGVQVSNLYFDRVPGDLIAEIVSSQMEPDQ
jgi:translation initiation factor 2B subunit (eIF-2B alpha/beta/delta family)